jgi:hypothetical protein
MTFHYLNGMEISLISEYLIEYLGASGTFLFFSGMNFIGFIFVFFFVKDTTGLSDKQKKELYMPKQI